MWERQLIDANNKLSECRESYFKCLNSHFLSIIEGIKKKIPEIIECHYTTGNWSIFIKLMCKDNEHLMNILNNKVQPIDGVSRTETFISLEQQIGRQVSP